MEATGGMVRYIVGDGVARVVVVLTADLGREAARRHRAAVAATVAMSRAGTAALLLATLTKGDERITLQILGQGPLGALIADATAGGTARMFVGKPQVALPVDDLTRPRLGEAVGRIGLVSVVRDLGRAQTFRGQTPIVDGEIDTDVERYLCDSEQIDSALACETLVDAEAELRAAAGILVQALPGGEGSDMVAAVRRRLRSGVVAAYLAQLDGGPTSPDALVAVALGETALTVKRLGDMHPVGFHCPCSHERAANTLGLLGAVDLDSMIREDGKASVTCEFCRRHYAFDEDQLRSIRAGLDSTEIMPN